MTTFWQATRISQQSAPNCGRLTRCPSMTQLGASTTRSGPLAGHLLGAKD